MCVNVTSLSAPKLNTAASDNNLRSSPTYKSAAIPTPPPTVKGTRACRAVVEDTLTKPPLDMDIDLYQRQTP